MRNRYLDLLRAVAIVRVIVYHHFGWPLLSIVFPAMGVMFAVAGSLTAASLAKRSAGDVVVSRARRLLPPVWLLGLVTVPAMLHAGWTGETGGEHPFQPGTLVFWLLPLGDPPGSDAGAFVWDALWYVRTYLWLVVLSPLLYPVFRRVGWPALALPLLLMAVLQRGSFGMPAAAESALWDLATYGACWLAGFAHRDGRLGRTSPVLVAGAFFALAGTGLYWLVQGHAETGWDLNGVSEAQAVYSLAFVLLALRWQPPIERLVAVPAVDRAVNLLNSRAVTVYLWHGVAIASVWPILAFVAMEDLGRLEAPVTLGITFAVTAVAVVLFGWAEDLAAKRRPRLWPATRTPAAAPVAPPVGPVPAGWPAADPASTATAPAGFVPEAGVLPSPVAGPQIAAADTAHMPAPGLRLGPDDPGLRLSSSPTPETAPQLRLPTLATEMPGVDMPVAGRPAPGFVPGAPDAHAGEPAPSPAPGQVPEQVPGGYDGVPWAGRAVDAGDGRAPWQVGPQRGASDAGEAPAMRYDGAP
ncbi:acyltransferase family protein [Actinoplanes sp. DH11]|uniref:acyltransferase family protein n=1 Tax=Actinoplanes sp. DH11 TaxID=2857011 RepID=UPI001E5DE0D6|nr:acyltransferase family protein [Actinoplanes sp. DH11]